MELFEGVDEKLKGVDRRYKYWSRVLLEHDFPNWFVEIAGRNYIFNWDFRIRELRSGQFFSGEWGPFVPERTLSKDEFPAAAEYFLERLAAVAVSRIAPDHALNPEQLIRSVEQDGFSIDTRKLELIPSEGEVSPVEEESRLARLITEWGLPRAEVAKKHLSDATEQYLDGTKDHPSLNESRSLFQSIIDQICEDISQSGLVEKGLPGGMKNRMDYLEEIGVWTNDERQMFGSAWGFLSAGGHPGLPPREQARIGLILAIEFSQVLIMNWQHWKRQAALRSGQEGGQPLGGLLRE